MKPLTGKAKQVAKIIPYDSRKAEERLREYEMLKNVRQEHIIRMFEAYHHNDYVILVLEKMYGENVARSLSLKNRYNEHHVASILKQVSCFRDKDTFHFVSVLTKSKWKHQPQAGHRVTAG